MAIEDSDVDLAEKSFDLDRSEAARGSILYLSSPAMRSARVVIRARERFNSKGEIKESTLTLKVRPIRLSDDLPPKLLKLKGIRFEHDKLGNKTMGALSLTSKQKKNLVRSLLENPDKVLNMLSKGQKALFTHFLASRANSPLRAFGPISERVWTVEQRGIFKPFTLELWKFKSGAEWLELSGKLKSRDVDRFHQECIKTLEKFSIALQKSPRTKTERLLAGSKR